MIATAQAPTYRGETLDESLLGEMPDSSGLDLHALRARMDQDGYLLLRDFHPRQAIEAGRRVICTKLAAAGALDTVDHDVMAGVMREGGRAPGFAGGVLHEMFSENEGWRAIHDVLYTGRLMQFFRDFFAQDVRHYDYTWMRLVNPGPATQIHADVVYMGRGTHELFTVWTPWGDTRSDDGQDLGGLLVLDGSHRRRDVLASYWNSDVDAFCLNKGDQRDEWQRRTFAGGIDGSAREIRDALGGTWRTCDYRMGDVVIFDCRTIHGGTDNHSNRVRLSTDTRYQRAADEIDHRWVGEKPVGHGPRGKRGMIC